MSDQIEMTSLCGSPAARLVRRKPSAPRCIPHIITRGPRGHHHVETWPGQAQVGTPGTGYLRSFDAGDWVAAAVYVSQVKAGRIEAPAPAGEYTD